MRSRFELIVILFGTYESDVQVRVRVVQFLGQSESPMRVAQRFQTIVHKLLNNYYYYLIIYIILNVFTII
jgi:hypothetical protein